MHDEERERFEALQREVEAGARKAAEEALRRTSPARRIAELGRERTRVVDDERGWRGTWPRATLCADGEPIGEVSEVKVTVRQDPLMQFNRHQRRRLRKLARSLKVRIT